ncbi:DUF7594 domain-containing protein [Paenibacillus sp. FA6]|uniref:CBM96 family carbohydrate-binding protein n=1 Tax=Paenibacillus sp. FA6 TaxID=3413029 RepID=UPI003F65DA7F
MRKISIFILVLCLVISMSSLPIMNAADIEVGQAQESTEEQAITLEGQVIESEFEITNVEEASRVQIQELEEQNDITSMSTFTLQAVGGVYTLGTEADTYVQSGSANINKNFATNEKILTGAGREGYLRFDLSDLPREGKIVKATMKLYKTDNNTNVLTVSNVVYDKWENNITYNTKPEVGNKLTDFTASGKNTFVSVDLTSAVQNEYQSDKKLSIQMEWAAGSIYANEFFSSRGAMATQRPILEIEMMTDAEIVASDLASLDSLNERTITDNLVLPVMGEKGSEIRWVSSDETVITSTGIVNQPDVNQADSVVTLTATVTYGSASQTCVITIHIPAKQQESPYILPSLNNLIVFAQARVNEAQIGTAPGQFPQAAKSLFLEAISEALTTAENLDSSHVYAIKKLINSGSTFYQSVVTSDVVRNPSMKLIEYSQYRKELVTLVWQAESAMLVEPEMYTVATKRALQDKIDHAKEVLNGTYELPFIRDREFVIPRPDEDIQAAIEYYSKAPSYGMSLYGLKPALQWYSSQHILQSGYRTVTLSPIADTYVNSNPAGVNYGSGKTVVLSGGNTGRSAFLKFDLSAITGNIASAELQITNAKADNNLLHIYTVSDDSWVESQLTYNVLPKGTNNEPLLGYELGKWMMGGLNNRSVVDVTYGAEQEKAGDQILSLRIIQDISASFPGEFHTKEAVDVTKWPALVVKMDSVDPGLLSELYGKVTGLANDLVGPAVTGSGVGQYAASAISDLQQKLAIAETLHGAGDVYAEGAALTAVYDSMRAMREAQVLLTDIESESTLFYTAQGLNDLKNRIQTNPTLKEEFNKLKAMSDEMTLEDIKGLSDMLVEGANLDDFSSKYKIWSPVSNRNFTTPAAAVTANISVTLPRMENEAEGLGHVWIDNLRVYPVTGADWDIQNESFESGTGNPTNWSPVVISGNPVMNWENRTNYSSAGTKSIYLENPTAADQGAWVYNKEIKVTGGMSNTLSYSAKNNGQFKEGVNVEITFKDINGTVVGSYVDQNNHKSAFGSNSFNLTAQTDALVYAVTGDISYAEKAKERIKWFTNDHLEGVESWLINNGRPFGYDAFGAVQSGRNAVSIASAYSLIKDSGVFSVEEKSLFLRQAKYWLGNLTDLRDRTELTVYEAQLNTGNWEMDMSTGASMLAMVLADDLPDARQWIDNGRIIVEGQLKYTIREDGGWPESIRYHFASLERIPAFAKALRNVTGDDWFQSGVVKNMFKFTVEVQTPPYEFFDGGISTPNFGDHSISKGTEFSVLGLYFDEIAKTDSALASAVYDTWARAGKPLRNYWGEALAMENFFAPFDFSNQENDVLQLKSTDAIRPWGISLFRNNFKRDNETYLAMVANEKAIGHNHYDQGSFILYANKEPLVMDPGIESYFDTSKNWYVGSSAHSTVQFVVDGVSKNTPISSTWEDFYTSQSVDSVKVKINHPSGAASGTQTRNIEYVKNGINAFVIWDQIKGSSDSTKFNLPVSATSTVVNGNKALSNGHYSLDLETTFLQPAQPNITTEFGRSYPQVPKTDGISQLNYIRAEAAAGESFLTVLYPKGKGMVGLSTEQLELGSASAKGYRVQTADGKWFIVIVNNSDMVQNISIPAEESLVDLKSDELLPEKAGKISANLEANGIHIFKAESLAEGTTTTIEITGTDTIQVPVKGTLSYNYEAAVIDQYNDQISGENVKWSLDSKVSGITVDENKGIVTVSSGAGGKEGIILSATAGTVTQTLNISINGGGLVPEPDPEPNPDLGSVANPNPSNTGSQTTPGSSSNLGVIREITANEMQNHPNNVITIALNEKENGISIPSSALNLVDKLSLVMTKQAVSLFIPSAVLKQLINLNLGSEVDSSIIIKLSANNAALPLKIKDHGNSSVINMGGQAYEIDLMLTSENSQSTRIDAFVQPVILTFPYDSASVDPELIAVYYFNSGSSKWEYIGGKVDLAKGQISTAVPRFGTYAVLEVNKTFSDVSVGHWANRTLKVLTAHNLVNGTEEDLFHPNVQAKRAEFTSMLVRVLGLDGGDTALPYTDVSSTAWYAADVSSAYAAGLIKGTSKKHFAPEALISREEMTVLMIRAYEYVNGTSSASGSALQSYTDANRVSSWAKDEVNKAIELGLVKGTDINTLAPQSKAMRSEMAQMIYNLLQKVSN